MCDSVQLEQVRRRVVELEQELMYRLAQVEALMALVEEGRRNGQVDL